MNKGIIILGAPASGKSHLEEEIYNYLYNTTKKHEFRINPDILVEDEYSEYYNNPLAASNYIYKTYLPEVIDVNSNFILQNTGANINTLRKIIDTPNYQFKAVVVYCNPIIAFIRNFSRDRKLPKQVLLENWLKVYSQMDEYIKLFGEDNIYIYETEYTQEEQELLLKNNQFGCVYDELRGREDESSFKKEETKYNLGQIIERSKKFTEVLYKVDLSLENIQKEIQQNKIPKSFIKEELIKWIT